MDQCFTTFHDLPYPRLCGINERNNSNERSMKIWNIMTRDNCSSLMITNHVEQLIFEIFSEVIMLSKFLSIHTSSVRLETFCSFMPKHMRVNRDASKNVNHMIVRCLIKRFKIFTPKFVIGVIGFIRLCCV